MDTPEDWNAQRIAVCGDLHGNLAASSSMIAAAAAAGCDTVVSVGDLGVWWPGDGDRFVNYLARRLDEAGLRMLFVDGNHEGWPSLSATRGHSRGSTHRITGDLWWADRGARWVWSGVRFGALGGAYSVDSELRRAGIDWWPGLEEPDRDDVEALVAGGVCDVLITHDAPAEVPLLSSYDDSPVAAAAQRTRDLISEAVIRCEVAVVFHGHWHHRHHHRVRIGAASVDVIGMGADIGPRHGLWRAYDVEWLTGSGPIDTPPPSVGNLVAVTG